MLCPEHVLHCALLNPSAGAPRSRPIFRPQLLLHGAGGAQVRGAESGAVASRRGCHCARAPPGRQRQGVATYLRVLSFFFEDFQIEKSFEKSFLIMSKAETRPCMTAVRSAGVDNTALHRAAHESHCAWSRCAWKIRGFCWMQNCESMMLWRHICAATQVLSWK